MFNPCVLCSLQYTSTKTVLVRNVGNREAKFSLETQRYRTPSPVASLSIAHLQRLFFTSPSPFSVTPSTATLAVGACMQVHIDFVPRKVGDHTAELAIHYDTGQPTAKLTSHFVLFPLKVLTVIPH